MNFTGEVNKAWKRVGIGRQRLRWALGFSLTELDECSEGDRLNLKLELLVFTIPDYLEPSGCSAARSLLSRRTIPDDDFVLNVQETFRSMLDAFAGKEEFFAEVDHPTLRIMRDGSLRFHSVPKTLGAAILIFGQLIATESKHLKICKICGKWFVANRTDAMYCDRSGCGSLVMPKRYRDAHSRNAHSSETKETPRVE